MLGSMANCYHVNDTSIGRNCYTMTHQLDANSNSVTFGDNKNIIGYVSSLSKLTGYLDM